MPSQQYQISREERILEYIKNNPGATKTDVIRYMEDNKYSSIKTTHNITKYYIKERILDSVPDNSNSQMHHLYINRENPFNLLYNELSETEVIMNGMERIIRIIDDEHKKINKMKKISDPLTDLVKHWILPYQKSIDIILRILLLRTSDSIYSMKESQILYSKITKLILKINRQFPKFPLNEQSVLIDSSRDLRRLKGSKSIEHFARSKNIELDVIDDLITKIGNFSVNPIKLRIVRT